MERSIKMNRERLKQAMIEDVNTEQNFEKILMKTRKTSWKKMSSVLLLATTAFLIFYHQSLPEKQTNDIKNPTFKVVEKNDNEYALTDSIEYSLMIYPTEKIEINLEDMQKQARKIIKATLIEKGIVIDEQGVISTRYLANVKKIYKGKVEENPEIIVLGGTALEEQYRQKAADVLDRYHLNPRENRKISTYLDNQQMIKADKEYLLFLNEDDSLVNAIGIFQIKNQILFDIQGNEYQIK